MKKFEFTLSFTEPVVWEHKIIIESTDLAMAYHDAMWCFAIHICYYDPKPTKLEISYREL